MFQCKHNIHNEKVRIICDHVFFSFATRSAVMANPNISSVESLRTSIKREACSQECECPFVRCLWQYPPISIDLADLVAYDEGVSEEDRRHSLSEQPSTPAVCSNSHLSRAAAGGGLGWRHTWLLLTNMLYYSCHWQNSVKSCAQAPFGAHGILFFVLELLAEPLAEPRNWNWNFTMFLVEFLITNSLHTISGLEFSSVAMACFLRPAGALRKKLKNT